MLTLTHAFAVPLERLSTLGAALAAVVFSLRLWQRMGRTYWPLSAFLGVEAAGLIASWFVPARSFFGLWLAVEVAKLGLAIILLWTLARLVFTRYPAIGAFATKMSKLTIAICLLLGWISFLSDPAVPSGRSPQLHLLIAIDRAIETGLLAFFMALVLFSRWFPVRMSLSLSRVISGFIILLATTWAGHLLANSATELTRVGNIVYSLVLLGTVLYWHFAVGYQEDKRVAEPLPSWDPDRLERMSAQLAHMEAQLSRRGY